MRKIVSFMVVLGMIFNVTAFANSFNFSDILESHWAYEDIKFGIEKGFFSGYPDGSFKPESSVTRAEAIKVITTFLERQTARPTESIFMDLDVNEWYAPYINVSDFYFPEKWIDEKLIKADTPITREETVYALVTAMQYDYKLERADLSLLKAFSDKEKIGFGLEGYMALALEFGIISGYQDNTLRPDANVTRGELAAIISIVSKLKEITDSRRDQVVDYMSKNAGVLWKSDKDFTYVLQSDKSPEEVTDESKLIHIKKDRIYRGVIYSYAGGDISSFLDYSVGQDENGVHTISGIDWQDVSTAGGSSARTARLGNDCGAAVCLALGSIGHDVSISGVTKITPYLGYPRVGKYISPLDYNHSTPLYCEENGEDVMYKAYSQLKKGDLLCRVDDSWSSHVRMVTDVRVIYDENGKIDPEKSLIVCHDQTKNNVKQEIKYFDENIGSDVYVIGYYNNTDLTDNAMFSFKEQCKRGYLPTTAKILVDPSPIQKAEVKDTLSEHNIENLFKGTIQSNWMIDKAQIEIIDSDGSLVQISSILPERSPETQYYASFIIKMSRFKSTTNLGLIDGKIDISALSAGEYTCKVKIRLVSDEEFTVREFKFSI
ncbi:MAG: S-layer homology domain-containing protein [Clostridia bacterium]|nr:S-layer homology domain-containing protein [Clostridia bacterium]